MTQTCQETTTAQLVATVENDLEMIKRDIRERTRRLTPQDRREFLKRFNQRFGGKK